MLNLNPTTETTKGPKNLSERNPREAYKIQSSGGQLAHVRRPGKKLGHEFNSESARAAALKRWRKNYETV